MYGSTRAYVRVCADVIRKLWAKRKRKKNQGKKTQQQQQQLKKNMNILLRNHTRSQHVGNVTVFIQPNILIL